MSRETLGLLCYSGILALLAFVVSAFMTITSIILRVISSLAKTLFKFKNYILVAIAAVLVISIIGEYYLDKALVNSIQSTAMFQKFQKFLSALGTLWSNRKSAIHIILNLLR